MATSDSQVELAATHDGHLLNEQTPAPFGQLELDFDQRHAGATPASSVQQSDAPNTRFTCPHCDKSYTTKKSLARHLTATKTACAQKHVPQVQSTEDRQKSRWACSRCGKDYASISSVERHISKSCWRICDECAADGDTICDSQSKAGACKLCESKGRACTKRTEAVPNSVTQPWAGPNPQPQSMFSVNDEASSTSQQAPAKRKTPTSLMTSPKEAHRNKRQAPAVQQTSADSSKLGDIGLGRGSHTTTMAKKEAVSEWLDGQTENPSFSITSGQQSKSYSPLLSQDRSAYMGHRSQQSDQFIDPSHAFSRALPLPSNVLPPQHSYDRLTPSHALSLHHQPLFQAQHTMNHQFSIPPALTSIPSLSLLGDGQPSSAGPKQLDQLFHQMQASRQQHEAHNFDMATRFSPRINAPPLSPIDFDGSRNITGAVQVAQSQGPRDTASAQSRNPSGCVTNTSQFASHPFAPANLSEDGSVLTLRVHSNTHDSNGQPVFSILRIRRNEKFGPYLDEYCASRGKGYGVDWTFVYRYQAATHQNLEQQLQITLSWDMTPNDVKDTDFPGMAMRNLDTIYVMTAKPMNSARAEGSILEGGAVQCPGPNVKREEVGITNGETNVFQNPDVSRQWYQDVEQDANKLRAVYGTMKSTIMQQKQQICTKDKLIAQLQHSITQLTTLSAQLRERMQLPIPNPPTHVSSGSNSQASHGRVIRQRPGPPQPPQRPQARSTAFVAKCEAVRDPREQPSQHLEPLQFPRFSGEFAIPDYDHESNTNAAYNTPVQQYARIYDDADEIAVEDGLESMVQE